MPMHFPTYTDNESLQDRLAHAVNFAERASDSILLHYQNVNLEIEWKEDQSPVTIADREAEQLLRQSIEQTFPEDGILGEEFGEKPSSNGFRWILDPIDGTKSFMQGVPLFGTLIGIEHQGELKIGVCRFPALDEVVYAAYGSGTWWQKGTQDPCRTSVTKTSQLDQALFCVTTLTGWQTSHEREVFETLSHQVKLTRGWGDCFGHILVATGRADVMIDPALSPWDAAALVPIVSEAGGHFLDWNGEVSIESGNGLSVNHELRNQILQITQTS